MFFADWSAQEPTCHPHWLWLVLHISIHRAGRLGYSRLVSSVEAFWRANKLEMAVPEKFRPPHIHQKGPPICPKCSMCIKTAPSCHGISQLHWISHTYWPVWLYIWAWAKGSGQPHARLPLKCTTPLLRQAIFHRRPSYHSSGFRKVTFSQLVSCSTRFSQEDRLLVIIQSLIYFLYWGWHKNEHDVGWCMCT